MSDTSIGSVKTLGSVIEFAPCPMCEAKIDEVSGYQWMQDITNDPHVIGINYGLYYILQPCGHRMESYFYSGGLCPGASSMMIKFCRSYADLNRFS
jgi:hypothetical protein